MFYHRMQGRHEKLTPPVKPTFDEPHELVEFIQRIKERFRTHSAEYLNKFDNITITPTNTVASIYSRYNDATTVVEKARAMTSEQLALRFLQLIPVNLQSHVNDWYFKENK